MLRFNGETSFFTQLVIRHPYRTLARQGGERSGPCRNVRVTELCEVKGDVPFRSRRGSNTEHTPLPKNRFCRYREDSGWRKKGSRIEKKITGTIWHNRWNREDVHASSLTQRGSWEYCRKRFGCRNGWDYAQKQQSNGISELNLSYIRLVSYGVKIVWWRHADLKRLQNGTTPLGHLLREHKNRLLTTILGQKNDEIGMKLKTEK